MIMNMAMIMVPMRFRINLTITFSFFRVHGRRTGNGGSCRPTPQIRTDAPEYCRKLKNF
jgi:hypothetical protein